MKTKYELLYKINNLEQFIINTLCISCNSYTCEGCWYEEEIEIITNEFKDIKELINKKEDNHE